MAEDRSDLISRIVDNYRLLREFDPHNNSLRFINLREDGFGFRTTFAFLLKYGKGYIGKLLQGRALMDYDRDLDMVLDGAIDAYTEI